MGSSRSWRTGPTARPSTCTRTLSASGASACSRWLVRLCVCVCCASACSRWNLSVFVRVCARCVRVSVGMFGCMVTGVSIRHGNSRLSVCMCVHACVRVRGRRNRRFSTHWHACSHKYLTSSISRYVRRRCCPAPWQPRPTPPRHTLHLAPYTLHHRTTL